MAGQMKTSRIKNCIDSIYTAIKRHSLTSPFLLLPCTLFLLVAEYVFLLSRSSNVAVCQIWRMFVPKGHSEEGCSSLDGSSCKESQKRKGTREYCVWLSKADCQLRRKTNPIPDYHSTSESKDSLRVAHLQIFHLRIFNTTMSSIREFKNAKSTNIEQLWNRNPPSALVPSPPQDCVTF